MERGARTTTLQLSMPSAPDTQPRLDEERARRHADPIRWLHASLDRRERPESIATLVLEILSDRLDAREAGLLRRSARHAHGAAGSSMASDFARPVNARRQVSRALELFWGVAPPSVAHEDDPEGLASYVARVTATLGAAPASLDFKAHRLDRQRRREAGLEFSRRRYNKLFRLAARLERKRSTLARELIKRRFTLIGKSRLASLLSFEDFSADRDSACFIAYFTARSNLRSEFTLDGQQRAFDEIAEMLFERCRRSPRSNWTAIARLFPDPEVLGHLGDAERGRLLGSWFAVLDDIAALLRSLWTRSGFDRARMVVRRGDDSTTWNNTASAFNKARDAWIALLDAMGMRSVLETFCFGKVLRLMAGDVARWHLSAGGALSPDTAVWSELPLPWDVLSGEAPCPLALVEAVCGKHGIDPGTSGWCAPRSGRRVEPFRPTPELVHGVAIGHAGLARILRKSGVFSGKPLRSGE